ncbi:immunoglobulin domain-containing protein [Taibaiella koreensis]|uniref:immunoglobulin domain-containing protein n=1 Tax=Taibaiella koreensis TaxID=1268548 RepID=UPI000E5A062F|nr:hypothetical protein [Taibaiella koreensis]
MTLLANVTFATNATDADTSNFSSLSVGLGLLGLVSATQNLRFTQAGSLPLPTSPLMVRFSGNGGLLGLANSILLQRTNGGINNPVGPPYTSSTLLDLLGLAGANNSSTEVVLPVPGLAGQPNDGVLFQINTTLGLGLSAKLYYAFFIKAPTVAGQTICSGVATTLTISNPQVGYTYRWYDSLTGGNQLQGSTSTTFAVSGLSATRTYYVEGCESSAAAAYRSGRTAVTVVVNPLPAAPAFSGVPAICSGATTALTVSGTDTGVVYRWYTVPASGTSFFTGSTYTTPALSDTTRYYVEAYRASSGCVSSLRTLVQVNVKPLPGITFTTPIYLCQSKTLAQLNYTAALNGPVSYSIAWGATALAAGFGNVNNTAFPASPVSIVAPGNATPQSYAGTLTLTGANTCTRSYPFNLIVQQTPHPPPPVTTFQ